MIVRDPRASWNYRLLAERPPAVPRNQATIWKFKHMTLADEHKTLDNLDRDSSGYGIRREAGSEHLNVLRRHLVGWENLSDKNGVPIDFRAGPLGGAADELLYLLPLAVREELAQAIENELEFDPEEVGKSELPST